MRVRRAIFFSDVHLGWVPLAAHHDAFLAHLPAAVAEAELVVLNGDILDIYRGRPSPHAEAQVARLGELVASWRREGRRVVYVEGNHDPRSRFEGPLVPEAWCHDFEGAHGERVRVLHGHKLQEPEPPMGPYERHGQHVLRLENWLYARSPLLRRVYPASIGWLVGAVGMTEDRLWRPGFYARAQDAVRQEPIDVLVHGHFHFGPGRLELGALQLHRTGAWVSPGHLGSVDRILRYQDGRFERLELLLPAGRWQPATDGR